VRGRGFFHEGAHQINEVPNDMIALVSAQRAGQAAYQEAGVKASDIDLAELYAPCTIIEILAAEALGLVPRGQGARLCSEGVTSLGGRIPVCTSGGLQSRGHPAHVTPFYSLFEINEQLTGRAGERARSPMPVSLSPAPNSATTMLRWFMCWRRSDDTCFSNHRSPPRLSAAHDRIHPTILAGSCRRAFRDDAMRRLRAPDVSTKTVLLPLLVA